jgi:hypothetical protein
MAQMAYELDFFGLLSFRSVLELTIINSHWLGYFIRKTVQKYEEY